MNQPDYLWDRSGPPDPQIERLEQTLSAFRMRERPLDFSRAPQPRSFSERAWRIGFAFAAGFAVLLVVLGYVAFHRAREGWQFVATAGTTQVDGKSTRAGVLRVGQTVENPSGTVLRLHGANIGDVELSGAARVQLLESRKGRQRLALQYGNMHASINALPAVFVVDTPAARAIDLGCEYTLNLAKDGSGQLYVNAGWVQLQYGGHQSLVPQGTEARLAPGGRFSPAYFPDATPAFRAALLRYTLEEPGPGERESDLRQILQDARLRDSFTLLNLFRASTSEERAAIFDRLYALVPLPGISRNAVIEGDIGALDPWWPAVENALGLQQIKKKRAVDLGAYPREP